MKSWCRLLTAALPALLGLSVGSSAQDTGAIRGTVVDETAAPVTKAKVNANSLDGRIIVGLVRHAETDAQGRFLIEGLDCVKYEVLAMKEDASYPNMYSSLYSDGVFRTLVITPVAARMVLP